jgi:uncharacterized membrane protein
VTLVNVVLPTLAVAGTWFAVAALIAGCGALARRGLLAVAAVPTSDRLRRSDLWIGLAVLTAFLQLWSLFAGISWAAWLPPAVGGLVGLAPSARALGFRRPRPLPLRVLIPAGVGILWLANRALDTPSAYDLGLYHAAAVEYASKYAAIPGLGNLHDRLAAGDAHFLITALLGHLPWAWSGFRLASGLLVAMLFGDVASRFAGGARGRARSFASRMSLVAVPAAIITAVLDPSRLSEPDLDLAAFVLVVVGALYLVESIEGGFEPAAAATCIAAFALASVNRPLFWLMTVTALAVLTARARHRLRGLLAVVIAPAALALGWTARQAILSGYPLFPLTFVRLPVDWRMPAGNVHELDRWTRSWARSSGRNPDHVLGSWAWLGPWLRDELTTYDVLVPLLLLVAAVLALLLRPPSVRPARALLPAIVVPSVVTLAAWFFFAPDPRFALGPLWLIPIALAAWALPESRPAAVRPRALLGSAAIVVALGVGMVHVAAKEMFVPIAARAEPSTTPPVQPFRTTSGLALSQPLAGSDQCWSVVLCTPAPSAALRLRGATIQSGFRRFAKTASG